MASVVVNTALRSAKEALRNEMKRKLANMAGHECHRQSRLCLEKLFKNERFLGSRRISVYLSTKQEVSTIPILEHIFKTGKECYIPKYDEESQRMDMVKLYSMADYDKLPETAWRIKQPAQEDHREEALVSGGLDLLLVPGLAFTKKGLRLGRGKGYYDIYVDRCMHDPHGRPYTIALAFLEQILPNVPTDENDFVVDEVLFPDE